MLTIVQRGGATREKPPEVVRGPASRLPWVWDGLCFAVPFNDATRDSARDLVFNAAPTTVSGLAWSRDNRGNSAALFTNADYMEYPYNPAHNRPSTSITVYVRMRRAGTADASGGMFTKRHSDVEPYQSWGIYQNDTTAGAVQGHLGVTGPGDPYVVTPDPYVLNTTDWVSVFHRWTSGGVPRVDVLGERGQILSSSTYFLGAISGTITYTTGEPIRINASEIATQNAYTAYSQAMVWSRNLTDTELQALVADPYGWYSPRRETLGVSSPYPLVAGAGEMRFGTGSGGLR